MSIQKEVDKSFLSEKFEDTKCVIESIHHTHEIELTDTAQTCLNTQNLYFINKCRQKKDDQRFLDEQFEGNKLRHRKSKKYNGQKKWDNKTNNDQQNPAQNPKD